MSKLSGLFVALLFVNATIFCQVPVINYFTPALGTSGTVVTINGVNFNPVVDSNFVYFGSARAKVISASTSSLEVIVPTGATCDPITVTSNHLTGKSQISFKLTFLRGGFLLPSTLSDAGSFSIPGQPSAVVGDINGDGKPDIVGVSSGDKFYVARNTSTIGNTSFDLWPGRPVYRGSEEIALGDLDGDGLLDVVVTNKASSEGSVSSYRNTSKGSAITFDSSFYTQRTGSTTFSNPQRAVIGDLDGNGKPELVVTNGEGTIAVIRNNSILGTIIFGVRTNISTPGFNEAVALSDLDGDGRQDIIVCKNNEPGRIAVLRNTSTATTMSFEAPLEYATGPGPMDLAIADLDGDGKPDIATGNYGARTATVTILRNTSQPGLISFSSVPALTADGLYGARIEIGDMDGDGKVDIVEGMAGQMAIFKNKSAPGAFDFELPVLYTFPGNIQNPLVADFDGDGVPDVSKPSTAADKYTVLRNVIQAPNLTHFTPLYGGAGSIITIHGYNFSGASKVTIGNQPASLITVVSDTVMTSVAGSGNTGNVAVTTSFGTGSINGFNYTAVPLIHNFSPLQGSTGTAITITGANFSSVPQENRVHFGAVAGQVITASSNHLTVKVPAGAEYRPLSITTANLTGYADKSFNVTFPGAPAGFLTNSFDTRINFPSTSFITGFTSADLDGDNKADILFGAYYTKEIYLSRNKSTGGNLSFEKLPGISVGGNLAGLTIADYDSDGKPDVATGSTEVYVLKNTSVPGNISFSSPKVFTGVRGYNLMRSADMNLDGKIDIVCMNSGSSFWVLRNTTAAGNFSFVVKEFALFYWDPAGMQLSDLNGDGKPEVILSHRSENLVSIFPNTSTASAVSFGDPIDYPTGSGPQNGFSVADMNSDGKPDIVISTINDGVLSVLINKVSPTGVIAFQPGTNYSSGTGSRNLDISDFDGDGKPDVVVVNKTTDAAENMFNMIKNTTIPSSNSVSFRPLVSYKTGAHPIPLLTGDWDLDGKPDVLTGNINDNTYSIFRNRINEAVIVPSGASPVAGPVSNRITIDPSVQTYNGNPYVQRHYDLEPAVNASAATATITLHFSQAEFDNYNSFPGHGSDLPAGPGDVTGIASLRVHQYHGFSASGVPGTYNGSDIILDPEDNKIIWNPAAAWWEVTFDVTGFSGFFIQSTNNINLPLQLLAFSVTRQGGNAMLTWTTTAEINVDRFEVQKSDNGIVFTTVQSIDAKNNTTGESRYQHADIMANAPLWHYRLKIIDKDGSIIYSQIVIARVELKYDLFYAYPNPASHSLLLRHPSASAQALITLTNMNGKVLRSIRPGTGSVQTTISVYDLPAGLYRLNWKNEKDMMSLSLVVN